MVQIFTEPGSNAHEIIRETIQDPDLDFQQAKNAAKKIALAKSGNCMVLSWKNGKTGSFFPKRECGTENKPAWIHYAETRGANLTVDINDGDYVFMIILIE
ncbi:MAG TPA: AF1514 family protein [Desulfobacteraceae bacterium]|nr:AF1514 family protein [Desulfobacteraceae bacterium]